MPAQKTVVVTGGASGIGLATTLLLLEHGTRVLAVDHSMANLESARQLASTHAGDVVFAALDVTQESSILGILEEHEQTGAPYAGLVNCAGTGRDIPFLETTTGTLRSLLEVNVIGTFSMGREVARRMAGTGGGSIVNVSSVSGLIGNKGRSAYGASKAAVINLTQVMANELARYGVRVNCICPGPITTPLAEAAHTESVKRTWQQVVPMKRFGTAREVATAIHFFLDEASSSFVTGQVMSVDGGFIASGLLEE